jgi:uncharacterized protein with ParB-like and HNH nuclease domain
MSYQTALTIAEVVSDIDRKKYLLPAIQREFVWSPFQIERLFDSLMRDYPISSFLFWHVGKENVQDYEFYEFLRDYHEKNNIHNPKASMTGEDEITAVLDGQQRLTSLYVGLKGTYAYKLPRKRWDNDQAFPKRKLYLNLLQGADNPELKYRFSFLTEKESSKRDEDIFWFPVGKVLDLKESYDVNQYLIDAGLFSDFGKEKASFANQTLSKLHSAVHLKPSISYYLEKSSELDKVLNIFIRINSGGTILSYSDLLLSIATAQWKHKDAREEINAFVDEANGIGNGFNFNKDFVLKACLVMSDFTGIAFKVDNFNKKNMLKIESEWDDITRYLRLAIDLIAGFGYSRDNLSSNYVAIPVAYYLKKIAAKESFLTSTKTASDRELIRQWIVLSLIKRVFGGQPDNVLRPLRNIIKEGEGEFPLNKIKKHFKGANKTLVFSDEDVENLIYCKYGQGQTFSVLSLLYPNVDFRNTFHVDHIFPKSKFKNSFFKKAGVSSGDFEDFKGNVDYIGNLQLLEAVPNIEKQNVNFDDWVSRTYTKKDKKEDYMDKNYIPDVDLSFSNFIEFVEEREALITEELKAILQK